MSVRSFPVREVGRVVRTRRRSESDSEIILSEEFRKSRQSRMLCHSRRILSRGPPRGFNFRLYRLWSREAIRRIFRYCFHLVNSSRDRDESWRYSRTLLSIASTVTSFRPLLPPERVSTSDASRQ